MKDIELAIMSDAELWYLWYQPDCPGCHEIEGGPMPSFCPDCGTDRSQDGALWQEIWTRGVECLERGEVEAQES